MCALQLASDGGWLCAPASDHFSNNQLTNPAYSVTLHHYNFSLYICTNIVKLAWQGTYTILQQKRKFGFEV